MSSFSCVWCNNCRKPFMFGLCNLYFEEKCSILVEVN